MFFLTLIIVTIISFAAMNGTFYSIKAHEFWKKNWLPKLGKGYLSLLWDKKEKDKLTKEQQSSYNRILMTNLLAALAIGLVYSLVIRTWCKDTDYSVFVI